MLRRRRRQFVRGDDEDPKKQLARSSRPGVKDFRLLAKTLAAAVWFAVLPDPEVRSQEYSKYLTSKVQGLTIGWHIFRATTEGAFLAWHGFVTDTVVAQVFWSMSVTSVLLHFLARPLWLRYREAACMGANLVYGFATVLKILHMVPRLPNEHNYMFKHCFLTMADAVFAQTPVHKQYVAQFAEAVIRIAVWRRYDVLPNVPGWGVVTVSLVWQIWLLAFSSMLQARHVSAFRRERAAAASAAAAASGSSSSGSTVPAAIATVTAALPAAMVPAPPSDPAITFTELTPVANDSSGAPGAAADTPAASSAPGAAAEKEQGLGGTIVGAGVGGPQALSQRAPVQAAPQGRTMRGGGAGMSAGWAQEGGFPQAGGTPQQGDSMQLGALTAAQMRYLRALRRVARGPSSYVLLAHQRKQAGGPQCTSAQFYIPSASPDMLAGNWREALASAVAEGAPGWQVANACVRKGSLIVHLDLVYGGELGLGAAGAAPAAACCDGGGGVEMAAAASLQSPFLSPNVAYSAAPVGGCGDSCKEMLEDYLHGMSAERLMQLLGLPPDLPAEGPLPTCSVQLDDQLRHLPPASITAAAGTPADSTASDADVDAAVHLSAASPDAAASASVAKHTGPDSSISGASNSSSSISTDSGRLRAQAVLGMLRQAVLLALLPPAALCSPEYAEFLTRRVGPLHLAYSAFICLTALAALAVRVRAFSSINPLTLMLFISAELLTWLSYICGRPSWRRRRSCVVYLGAALRTVQMAACTFGSLPHVLKDSDCTSGRWVQKVVLITTLQALCMQPPVRSFFLVRLPCLALVVHVHVHVCRDSHNMPVLFVAALHVVWEGLLFVMSSCLQQRHYGAFLDSRGGSQDSRGGSQLVPGTAPTAKFVDGMEAADGPPHSNCAAVVQEQLQPAAASGSSEAAVVPAGTATCEASVQPAVGTAMAPNSAAGPETRATADLAAPAPSAAATVAADPSRVSLNSPVVALAPRRAAHLQLHFTCAPAVVDELQVVLRHVNPASMSSGVHAAHAVRDITHALVAPYSVAAAAPHVPAAFTVELTLVASPADMPGLIHVELWRGRRRVSTQAVLLAAAPLAAATAGAAAGSSGGVMSLLHACAARVSGAGGSGTTDSTDGSAAAVSVNWLDDVVSYVEGLRWQGHGSAADQFVEELGGWLAQAAAVDRGLTAAAAAGASTGATGASGGSAAAPRIANVLYFHGHGSEYMYVKPRRVSVGGGAPGASPAAAAPAQESLQGAIRQLLLCQGSMLLAVAAEAGCVALAHHLVGLMAAQLGATVAAVLEEARAPVTQLPLLHAAVKSGSAQMVDLVAEWCASCGHKDIWATEAAVLAVSLEPAGAEGTRGAGGLPSHTGSALRRTASGRSSSRRSLHTPSLDKAAPYPFRCFEREPSTLGATASGSYLPPPAVPAALSDRPLPPTASADTCIPNPADPGGVDSSLPPPLPHLSEDAPFRVISFRGCQRALHASSSTASPSHNATAAAPAAANVCGAPTDSGPRRASHDPGVATAADAGLAADASCVSSSCGWRRSEDDGALVEGGVVVLTPLHLALALGDEGRLAGHILSTYPEAYELWRMNPPAQDVDSLASASAGVNADTFSPRTSASAGDGSGAADPSLPSSPFGSAAPGMPAAATAAASAGVRPLPGLPETSPFDAAVAGAFSSLPGMGRSFGGFRGVQGGTGGVDASDSMDVDSLQSMSLSEVAFLEGMRWVDEDATAARRGGFKVTRM